ncbi:glycosyltransferase [Paracraurococcus lichenis]|uniref:Glycosyltransferase n=1 Tax=Paracraurococcus lichenis TaxID=3064888 RepID=A0ABT9E021_9PROT|nr:glycosyltransferase [Paracraurococcus sp. LOR1-02]MDO9709475.1 glycosyltransferase [Paracraurococcus sp. LOR1-02]
MTAPPAALAALSAMRGAALRTVIAIPARDEADCLPACLAALAAQRPAEALAGTAVLLLANNCSDGTAAAARAMAPDLPFPLVVLEAALPPGRAHAGGARAAAMEAAAALLGEVPGGALLCTDADARPEPGWLAANLAELAAGADAVAGAVLPDPAEAARLPATLRRREAEEARYAALLDEMAARIDPIAHDPGPTHGTHSGASIALRLAAWRAVGGIPLVPRGEDRALFAALARRDARIRHSEAARVLVSCRLDGRAGGGMAATLRRRLADPHALVDDRLEPARRAWLRLRTRRALRLLRAGAPRPGNPLRLQIALGIAPAAMRRVLSASSFGLAWEALQAATPALRRVPLDPAALPRETAIAAAILAAVRATDLARNLAVPADPAGSARPAAAG